MRKALLLVGLLVMLSVDAPAQPMVYWTDYDADKVQRANADGTAVADVATGQIDANAVVVDNVHEKVYWGKGTSDAWIRRANLDGGGVEDVVSSLINENVTDIALDLEHGKIYWTNNYPVDYGGTPSIRRANLDGSAIETLLTVLDGGRPSGIGLDVAGGKMYWAEWDVPRIRRANLDGSSVQDLITVGLGSPYGLELDLASSTIFFSDFGTGKIQRANLDGTGVADVLTGLGYDVDAVAVDGEHEVLYYATYQPRIARVGFGGAGNADVVTGLQLTTGVAYWIPNAISGNAGAAGATITYTGGSVVAGGDGSYSFRVPYDWSGTVTPSLAGHTFSPASRDYTTVFGDQAGQDFAAVVPVGLQGLTID